MADNINNLTLSQVTDDPLSITSQPPFLNEKAISFMLEQIHKEVILNWTRQQDLQRFDVLHHPVCRAVILMLNVSVILLGLTGNGIILFIVASNRKMQNNTNIYIANLALSDIGLCIFSLPLQLHYQLTDSWVFGEVMCRVLFAAFAVPMYVSTLTILLIAFDRFWLIVYPLKEQIAKTKTVTSIILSVVISMLLAVPVIIFSTVEYIEVPDIGIQRTYCLERWPSDISRMIYTLLTFLFQFCLPLCLTAFLYSRIYYRLLKRPQQRVNRKHTKLRTNQILISIVVIFMICWLPWNVFIILSEFKRELVDGPYFKLIDLTLKLLALGSSSINPFLYCWLNENFRKELKHLKRRMYRVCKCFERFQSGYQVQIPQQSLMMGTDNLAMCSQSLAKLNNVNNGIMEVN